MIENFNGIIYLAIFIIHFLAYAFYAYRTIFTTKAFLDQYGMDVTGSIMTRFFGKNKSWLEGLSILPFAIFSALSFTIPYLLAGIFLGPEFPSIIGGLLGLIIVTTAIKRHFLIPKDTWDFPKDSEWPSYWLGELKISNISNVKQKISTINSWFPYIFLAIL